jgi:hypothetical protein
VVSDPDLSDALFLMTNPGWTWQALQEAPAIVIDLMRAIRSQRPDPPARKSNGRR